MHPQWLVGPVLPCHIVRNLGNHYQPKGVLTNVVNNVGGVGSVILINTCAPKIPQR